MKLVIILITVACLQVSASALAQKKVTLNEKDAPLEKIFNEIKEQTGCNFFYEHNILDGTSKVTINVKDANLPEVLNLCLANQPLVYTIAGNNIGVKKKEIEPIQSQTPQPPKDIIGQVSTKQGVPLESASVTIKRTKTLVLTDAKGNFTLRSVTPDDIFTVTYVGYKPITVKVGDKNVFNLTMEEATNSLDAVVVQAYGKTSNRLNTGDISTVTAKEIENQPVMNPLQALEGKVPGMTVTQTSGYASGPFKVEIEGRSQFDPNFPSEPLYVIDGVPLTILGDAGDYVGGSAGIAQNGLYGPAYGQSPLFSLNPQDIESISVLKDASATSIYGSRGANGVILITTKKGQAGKTKLDASFTEGIQEIDRPYQLLNTQQYLEMRKEAYKNSNLEPGSEAYDLLTFSPTSYTNWENYFWGGTGHNSDLDLALSGGDKQTTFRISGNYNNSIPFLARGSDKKTSLQFNLTHHSLNQRLTLSYTSDISYTQSDIASQPSNLELPPNAPPIFNSEGQPNWSVWDTETGIRGILNGLVAPNYETYLSKTLFLNTALNLNYQLTKGLNFSTEIGYNTYYNQQKSTQPIAGQDPALHPTGTAYFGNNSNSNFLAEPNLDYKTVFGKGDLDVLLGATYNYVEGYGSRIIGNGYVNDLLLGSETGASSITGTDGSNQYKYEAIFARFNYNWESKYLVNLSFRRDGSSNFGPGHQFGNFAAIGAAWIFTEEDWAKNSLGFLTFGKLRGSYGTTGKDNISPYQYLSRWGGANFTYNGSAIFIPLGLENPDLHWETDKKLEVALDLGFLKDRITAEISVYKNVITGELGTQPLPFLTGFSAIENNFPGVIQNTGILASLQAKLIDKKDFQWSVNFNIGTNNNILKSFPNLDQTSYAYLYTVGESLNIKRVLHYTGIDPQTGQYTYADKNNNGVLDYEWRPGNPGDRIDINTNIKANGGFGTDFRYHSFQLSLFFHYAIQPYVLSTDAVQTPGVYPINIPVNELDRWQKPGDNTAFARYTVTPNLSDQEFEQSDGAYSNGSYIRLQNAALSYDLKDSWTERIGISHCQVYFRGEYLFLWTKFNGLDPEVPGYGVLPPPKTFTIGLKFNL